MNHTIENKTIWVTGASSGIGKAVVEKLAQTNNFIIISARSEDKLNELKREHPDKIAPVVYDLLDEQSNQTIAQRLAEHTDHIDLVIMCAGTCEYDNGPDFEEKMYRKVMDTNFIGTVNTLRACKQLVEKSAATQANKPRLVAVGSMSSLAAFPRAEVYGASKAAIDYLMECVSIDLHKKGIDVSIVRPGFVDTPLTKENDFPMPWLMQPEEAAEHIIKGIAKKKRYIHFPWKLSAILKIAKIFPSFWVGFLGPKLVKKESL